MVVDDVPNEKVGAGEELVVFGSNPVPNFGVDEAAADPNENPVDAVEDTAPENDEAVDAVEVVPVATPKENGFSLTTSTLLAPAEGVEMNGDAVAERPKVGLVTAAGPNVNGFDGDGAGLGFSTIKDGKGFDGAVGLGCAFGGSKVVLNGTELLFFFENSSSNFWTYFK